MLFIIAIPIIPSVQAGSIADLFLGRERTADDERPQVTVGDRNIYALLDGDNNWTGVNTFYNYTWINYENFDVNGTMNVTEICIGAICINNWSSVNNTGDFVPYEGAIRNIDLNTNNITNAVYISANDLHSGNSVFTAFLQDNFGIGSLDMSGHPWILLGASLHIDQNFSVDGYIKSNLTPSPSSSLDLGSNLSNWRTLYVDNITSYGVGTLDLTSYPWFLSTGLEIREYVTNDNNTVLILSSGATNKNATLTFDEHGLDRWSVAYDGF